MPVAILNVFKSFIQGGFEGATGYNRHGEWIDQVAATQHDLEVDADYRRLREAGLLTAREVVRWPLVDRGGGLYDFSSLDPFLLAAEKHGVEVIHDLFHFGYPAHVDLWSSEFPRQFADYCEAASAYIVGNTSGPYWFTTVNEPSYFSWAGGHVGLFAPYGQNRGYELKVQLLKAAIKGIDAIRGVCPQARIVNPDPLCRATAPLSRPDLTDEVECFNEDTVFQSWDILSGRLMPELGGSPEHLDIIGINYYWTNQWEWGNDGPLEPHDSRRWPLSKLIQRVSDRYHTELLITETSHVGELRPVWLRELSVEVESLLKDDIPLRGVCLYPILGMPEWHAREEWAQMGLWDLQTKGLRLHRELYQPMMEALDSLKSL